MGSNRASRRCLLLFAFLLLIVALTFAAGGSVLAAPATIYVNAAAAGADTGTSWADAYQDLQDALATAASGDQIWVATGTYWPTPGTDRTVSFELKSEVALYGGFPASGDPEWVDRDWVANETILSGDLVTEGDTSDNSYRVVVCVNHTGAVLDGFTITGGNADGPLTLSPPSPAPVDRYDCGAGVYSEGNATFRHLVIESNQTRTGTDNADSRLGGGGMMLYYSTAVLDDVTFRNNSVTRVSPLSATGCGGGLLIAGAFAPALHLVTFANNQAEGHGGGLYVRDGSAVLDDVVFEENRATHGGGIYFYTGGATVKNAVFKNNEAVSQGGAIKVDGQNVSDTTTLANCLFAGNYCSENSVTLGGALNVAAYNVEVSNSTFTQNSAYAGGAVAVLPDHDPHLTLTNSILWGNTATIPTHEDVYGSNRAELSYCIYDPTKSSAVTGGVTNLNAEPLFVGAGDYSLSPTSPAIDAGDNSAVPAGITTDLAGKSRIINGRVDMGAYEYGEAPAITSADSTTFIAGTFGSFPITATGWPVPAISIAGAPHGITFTDNGDGTATFSGAPVANTGGIWTFTVTAANGVSPDATQTLTVTINEAPVMKSATEATFTTGTAGSFYIVAWGAPIPSLSYTGTLPSGVVFTTYPNGIASLSGTPAAGTGGIYPLSIKAVNGISPDASQSFTLTVIESNRAPTDISLSSTSLPENAGPNALVGTLSGTDPDVGDSLTFSLPAATDDNTLFNISGTELRANASFDYEAKSSYTITVRVTDAGGLSYDEQFVISVTDVNQAPTITSNGSGATASVAIDEGTTFVTTVTAADPNGDALTYSIAGGVDAALFTIDPARGTLRFLHAPDFYGPEDADHDNVYEVTVRVTDDGAPALADTQTLSVTVLRVQPPVPVEHSPHITSNGGGDAAYISVPENTTAVTTVTGVDPDGDSLTYGIFGGPDAAMFGISASTGVLSFLSAPDYEHPADADRNNVYLVTVLVSDGSFRDVQAISVTVTNVDEQAPPVSNRWTDITDDQWQTIYGVTAAEIDRVADGGADGAFRPNALITRAQFTKMVVDGLGIAKAVYGPPIFMDVPAGHVFFPWIQGGAQAGLLSGFAGNSYRPEQPITRQQANTILGRYLSAKELADRGFIQGSRATYPTLADWYAAEGAAVLAPFADRSLLAAVHAPQTAYLVYHQVVQGSVGGTGLHLMPLSNLTRAQAAVMIVRLGQDIP